MPQLSPLKWLLLFIFFSAIYLIFASIMYFNTRPSQLNTEQKVLTKSPWPENDN